MVVHATVSAVESTRNVGTVYRRRLETDLSRWEADGTISADVAGIIRNRLPPIAGLNVAVVIAIAGGLLIAAAFLTFVAANWSAIIRPLRLAILLGGILGAYAIGAWFDRTRRDHLADLASGVGAIIFGAAIALVGQMYHLGGDFTAAVLLWAIGAVIAAGLTNSLGALATALVAVCVWNGMRVVEASDVYTPIVGFIAFWAVATLLVLIWNRPTARHLVSVAAVVGILTWSLNIEARQGLQLLLFCAGMSLLLGAGLALATRELDSVRALSLTLANYGAVALAIGLAFATLDFEQKWTSGLSSAAQIPTAWAVASAFIGLFLAGAVAAITRRIGPALVAVAIGLALASFFDGRWLGGHGFWLAYALALSSLLSLIISGILDDIRPRVFGGWVALAMVIAIITWGMEEPLRYRALFLVIAGIVAIALAAVLERLAPRKNVQ